MTENKYTSLCRICLEDGANIPIFKCDETGNLTIHSKLSACVKEKIEDIDGFPRCICDLCKSTLDVVYQFVLKYKETYRLLQNSLANVKQEAIDHDFSDFDNNIPSEYEIEIDNLKTEHENEEKVSSVDELLERLPELVVKRESKTRSKRSSDKIHKTNTIASAILENSFMWTGDKWCLTRKVKKKPNRKLLEPKTEKHIKMTIKIPKVKEPKVKLPPPPKLCDLCGEVFKNQNRLRLHRNKVHFKKPAVKCPHCPRTCASEYYLNRHLKRKHLDENDKPFACTGCEKRFAFKTELTAHFKVVHKKVPKKKHSCQFCDKVYMCAKSVQIHERSIHTGDRPAVCTVCDSSFYHEDYLKEHMRLHTGETPFKCPICGRGYAQRANMKSHIQHNHKLSDVDPETLRKLKPSYIRRLKQM